MYVREMRTIDHNGNKFWVVLARSEFVPSLPEKPNIVRVDDYLQSVALTSDGKAGTKGTSS